MIGHMNFIEKHTESNRKIQRTFYNIVERSCEAAKNRIDITEPKVVKSKASRRRRIFRHFFVHRRKSFFCRHPKKWKKNTGTFIQPIKLRKREFDSLEKIWQSHLSYILPIENAKEEKSYDRFWFFHSPKTTLCF